MKTLRSNLIILALLGAAALAACDGNPTGDDPQLALLAGEYSAEGSYGLFTLTTDDGSETIDWLAMGGSIVLDLNADGTTAGRLFIPGGDEDGGDLDQDLVGTWTVSGETVRLDHEADTFLRDMELTFEDGRLSGEETFAVTVRVELARR